MLYELAKGDYRLIKYLKSNVNTTELYERYYKIIVKKLNDKIEHVAYLRNQ
jgi:hypothetical protein